MIEDDKNKLPFCERKMFLSEDSTTVVPTEESKATSLSMPDQWTSFYSTHSMIESDTSDENNSNQAASSSVAEVSTGEELQVNSTKKEELKQGHLD